MKMRWALVGLALLLAIAGLLYRGGVAFMSTMSDTTSSPGVDGPGTVAITREAPARTDFGLAGPAVATRALAPEPSRANPAGPEPSPAAEPGVPPDPEGSQQNVFRSRRALETVDAREFLRQNGMPK
jgi:hypothetical protein